MKQGQILNRIIMVLLFVAVTAYLAGAAWRGFREPYPTSKAYAYAVEDTVEAAGYLVRQEQVLTGSGGVVRLLPAEGEKVAVGATVALVYADRTSLERSERIAELESQVEQISGAMAAVGETPSGESGRQTVDALVALRSAVAQGDLTRLEARVSAYKTAVYEQVQRQGGAEELSAALSSAQTELQWLRSQTSASIGLVSVDRSGIFSGRADGYESVLTPQSITELTPAYLRSLEGAAAPVSSWAVGKLITDSTWYFICSVPEKQSRDLAEGGSVTVRFSRDWSGEVKMKVERISAPEDGVVAVTLSSNRYLSDVTLLRRQTVELVFSSQQGIRVPTEAIRVEDITETDPDTGETRVIGQVTCVYVRVGVQAERKPVNILAQGSDYYIVTPALPEDPTQAMEKKALRPGDDVIVGGVDVFDGKVLQ